MRRIYVIATAAVLIAAGCRSAENRYQANSLTGRFRQDRFDTLVVPGPQDGSGVPAIEQTGSRRVEPIQVTHRPDVQPVVYRQEPGDQLPLETNPPPMPPSADIELSNLLLADLEGIALQYNPSLAQAAARVEAAQGNWVQVGLPPNPALGYSGQQLGSGGLAEQHGVFIGQEFITGKKLRLNREIAAWEVERAQRELEAFRLRVLTDVRIGYYDVLIAQRRRDLAADLVRISEQGEKVAQSLFDGEEVSEADPLRARVEADTARILNQNAINLHVEAWRRLTAVLGMPDLVVQRLEGELEADDLGLSWQETLRQVLSESPEIAAALADVEAAQWAIERAYAEVIPNVDVQAVIQDDRGTGSTNGNLQVSIPIPLWNRNQGAIRQARAEAAAATQAVDRLAVDLQARLATAFQRYESARNQVEKYSGEDGILDTSQRTLELIQSGYEAAEFSVLELLSAQRTHSQTNLAYLDSLRELWVSTMEIRGLLLRDSLGQ